MAEQSSPAMTTTKSEQQEHHEAPNKEQSILPKSAFDAWDVAAAYTNEVDHYPLYAEDDHVRDAALDWVVAQLEERKKKQRGAGAEEGEGEGEVIRCLDVGCVHGKPTVQRLAEKGYQVTGLDLEGSALLEVARRSGIAGDVRFVGADVREWEPPNDDDGGDGEEGWFDAVTCFFVFCHFAREEYAGVLGRLAGWLKHGGVLALGCDDVGNGWRGFERARAPISSASMAELREVLEGVGLSVVREWEEDWRSPGRPDRPARRHQMFLCRKGEKA